MDYLSKNIKKVRVKWGYTQERFADLFNKMSRGKIATYEAGTNPDVGFVIKLEELSGITVYEIYSRELLDVEIPTLPNLGKYSPAKEITARPGSVEERLEQIEARLRQIEEVANKK